MPDGEKATWTFLTNHAAVLLGIYRGTILDRTSVRVRDIAEQVGVTERTVHHVLNDLEAGGYIARHRVGTRTHYEIHADLPLRRPDDNDYAVRMLLDTLSHDDQGLTSDGRDATAAAGPSGGELFTAEHVTSAGIDRALKVLRVQLGLDVAFVSQVHDGRRWFTHVDAGSEPAPIEVGGSDPVEESYCHYVIDGQIPELLIDPARHPVASRLPATEVVPVGTHLSVPVRLADGRVYGTCCSFSYDVRTHVDDRDLAAVSMLAQLVASQLDPDDTAARIG